MIKVEERLTKKIPGNTSLFVSFPYSSDLVAVMKECSPANYSKKDNTWEIPTTRLAKFLNLASNYDDIELSIMKDEVVYPDKVYDLQPYKTKPYRYQEEGIQYGLNRDSWLLLDSPGLGKTLQMLYLAQELKEREDIQHCLIICGINTLKTNWEKEILKHTYLDCTILGKTINSKGKINYGSIKDRVEQLKNPIKEFFVIVNIESLRSDDIIKVLTNPKAVNKFDMILFDECHVCKSPQSQQTKNLLKLTHAKYRIAMTGTLLLNNPLDAYVPLKWIGKDNSTYSNFKSQYCIFGGNFGNELIGYKNIDVLKDQIKSCSLRRTKDLLDLPPKNVIHEYLDMSPQQEIFYNNIVNGVIDQVDKVKMTMSNLLAMVGRLRQASACPSILTTENIPSAKIDRTIELIEEIVGNGNKVVVFSTFKKTLDELMPKVSQYAPLLCTGDIPEDVISNNIDKFQTNEENKVILCTHQKMGTGVTLTAASYAIFIDTPWTAANLLQCEDRIHRIGSDKPVFIYILCCNNTFDQRVEEIVDSKDALGDYIIDNKHDERVISLLSKWIKELR